MLSKVARVEQEANRSLEQKLIAEAKIITDEKKEVALEKIVVRSEKAETLALKTWETLNEKLSLATTITGKSIIIEHHFKTVSLGNLFEYCIDRK